MLDRAYYAYCPALESDVFLLDPSNRPFVEGKKPDIKRDYQAIIAYLVLLVACSFFAAFLLKHNASPTLSQIVDNVRLIRSSALVQGVVISYRVEHINKNETTWFVTYQYSVQDRVYTHESKLGRSAEPFAPGVKIMVSYEPENPVNSTLIGSDISLPQALLSLIGDLIFALCFALLSIVIPVGLITGRVWVAPNLNIGRIVPSQIVSLGIHKNGNAWQIDMLYTYSPAPGVIKEDKDSRIRNDLRNRVLPEFGTPLAILYVSEKLTRLM